MTTVLDTPTADPIIAARRAAIRAEQAAAAMQVTQNQEAAAARIAAHLDPQAGQQEAASLADLRRRYTLLVEQQSVAAATLTQARTALDGTRRTLDSLSAAQASYSALQGVLADLDTQIVAAEAAHAAALKEAQEAAHVAALAELIAELGRTRASYDAQLVQLHQQVLAALPDLAAARAAYRELRSLAPHLEDGAALDRLAAAGVDTRVLRVVLPLDKLGNAERYAAPVLPTDTTPAGKVAQEIYNLAILADRLTQ